MRKVYLIVVLALVFFVGLIPGLYRLASGNTAFVSDTGIGKSYDYATYAKSPNGMPDNLYVLLLAGSSQVFGEVLSSMFLPVLLGFVSLLFLYLGLRQIGFKKERLIILLVFAFSPGFIYVSSVSLEFSLMQALFFAGVYFLLRKSALDKILSVVLFGLLGSFKVYSLLIPLTGLFFYTLVDKKKRNVFFLLLIISLILLSLVHIPAINEKGSAVVFVGEDFVAKNISDFGGEFGVSAFALLLFFFGLFITWGAKKKFGFLYLYSLLLVIFGFFIDGGVLFSNIIVSFYAGLAIIKLWEKYWYFKKLKMFTVFLIVCSLLFSSIASVQIVSDLPPGKEEFAALSWLKSDYSEGFVLSSLESGFRIKYFEALPFLNVEYKNLDSRVSVANAMFFADDFAELKVLLKENDISYILLTPEMSSEMWDDEESGLLFWVRNSETFNKVYSKNGFVIWKVLSYE